MRALSIGGWSALVVVLTAISLVLGFRASPLRVRLQLTAPQRLIPFTHLPAVAGNTRWVIPITPGVVPSAAAVPKADDTVPFVISAYLRSTRRTWWARRSVAATNAWYQKATLPGFSLTGTAQLGAIAPTEVRDYRWRTAPVGHTGALEIVLVPNQGGTLVQ